MARKKRRATDQKKPLEFMNSPIYQQNDPPSPEPGAENPPSARLKAVDETLTWVRLLVYFYQFR